MNLTYISDKKFHGCLFFQANMQMLTQIPSLAKLIEYTIPKFTKDNSAEKQIFASSTYT